jgi:hypothetical protein
MAINAFMVPCVYFFFPETAYRSLEEMDEVRLTTIELPWKPPLIFGQIFHKVHGWKGAFTVVKVARDMPHRYGKNGELLIAYDETEEARDVSPLF